MEMSNKLKNRSAFKEKGALLPFFWSWGEEEKMGIINLQLINNLFFLNIFKFLLHCETKIFAIRISTK